MLSLELNPALVALMDDCGNEFILGQVLVRRVENEFELRHILDRDKPLDVLRRVQLSELRNVGQFTADGVFRPLKSAPNLAHGWTATLANKESLGQALNHLYPGAVADWFTAKSPNPPVTGYREFTERQTGMYRITTMMDDATAAEAIRTCCDKSLCLKRRLWSVQGLEADGAGEKSIIPCLEPCAVMLEQARKAARFVLEKQAGTVKA